MERTTSPQKSIFTTFSSSVTDYIDEKGRGDHNDNALKSTSDDKEETEYQSENLPVASTLHQDEENMEVEQRESVITSKVSNVTLHDIPDGSIEDITTQRKLEECCHCFDEQIGTGHFTLFNHHRETHFSETNKAENCSLFNHPDEVILSENNDMGNCSLFNLQEETLRSKNCDTRHSSSFDHHEETLLNENNDTGNCISFNNHEAAICDENSDTGDSSLFDHRGEALRDENNDSGKGSLFIHHEETIRHENEQQALNQDETVLIGDFAHEMQIDLEIPACSTKKAEDSNSFLAENSDSWQNQTHRLCSNAENHHNVHVIEFEDESSVEIPHESELDLENPIEQTVVSKMCGHSEADEDQLVKNYQQGKRAKLPKKPRQKRKITAEKKSNDILLSALIAELLQSNHPSLRFNISICRKIEVFLRDIVLRIAEEAETLMALSDRKNFNQRVLKYAIKLSLEEIKREADVAAGRRTPWLF